MRSGIYKASSEVASRDWLSRGGLDEAEQFQPQHLLFFILKFHCTPYCKRCYFKMAEILAVAASGMSVVSLAIQITESIQKLKDFSDNIKNAPVEIRLALDEVEILSLVLEDIDQSIQQELFLSPLIQTAVMKSLRLCRVTGEALTSLVKEMEANMDVGKKRGALKFAMKKEKLDHFRQMLENAKLTILLANQCYNQ